MPTIQKPELYRDPIAFFIKRLMYKLARSVFVSVLAFALAIFLIVIIRDMVEQIRHERDKQQWLVERLNVVAQLYDNQGKARQLRGALETLLPSRIEVATKVVPQLRDAAKTHNVKMDFRIGADSPAVGNIPNGISFVLKLDGTPENIVDFLTVLETEKLVAMGNWELLPIDYGSPASPKYQLNTAGTLFIRDDDRFETTNVRESTNNKK